MEEIVKFLKEAETYYLATVEGGQGADGYVEDRRHALGEEGVRERGV